MGDQKARIVKDELNEKVFQPAIKYGKETHNSQILQGVNWTKMRVERLATAEQVIHYFWSAIIGTEKSKSFYHIMKEAGVTTFEDIQVEFREKFNDEWLRS